MAECVDLPTSERADLALIQRLRDTLARAVELEEIFEAQHRLPIDASSLLRRDEEAGNAASGFNTASAAMVGALDHLLTWYQVVAGDLVRFPLPAFSQYTLARASYEPALLTLWLLDPKVDSVERIGRGYAAQLGSLDYLRKFQSARGAVEALCDALDIPRKAKNNAGKEYRRNLQDRVDDLAKKGIDADVVSDMHEARLVGNDSLHDGLSYSRDELADIANLIAEAVQLAFVQPAERRAMREARKARREAHKIST